MTSIPENKQNEISKDGFIVDTETGEVLGHAQAHERFVVDSSNAAEWVLERIQAADADVAACDARLKAISENIAAMRKEHEKRKDWLLMRFAAELEAFAAAELDGKKTRTFKTPFGSLSFRTAPGSVKVLDMEEAVKWAKMYEPEAVKVTETVLVSKVTHPNSLPDCFEVSGPADKFYIKTGV